jgi:lambda family phage portal protein
VFRCDRPGQTRGVPWGAPVMITMRDLDDYEDAYLFRQKMANCQVGVVTDGRDAITGDFTGSGNVEQPALSEQMEPGRFDFLPAGKDIKFNTPPSAGDYGPFTRDVLLRVAAAYGITYEALTGNLAEVNFSSGRMGWLEMQRNIEAWRWHMLIPQGLNTIADWFKEAIEIAGAPSKNIAISWTPPRREMIDPTKETAAYIEAMRGGIMSLPDVHRQLGEDSDAVLDEIAATNKKLDQLELTFDSDPRKQNVASTVVPGASNV